ncbi:MAG: hypothetical protein J0H73_13770 [Salana multivorans]|uniref:hypothetical protein n=1 Tax=Salana multivorans TaxID=120377 RepID=UPI0009672229|nr:hypothetical protein [Salana multivorans]MBN8883368.1 hypothetical protein [Salana multivorans]OJX97434.1 MAG: hypothetical protein BGO96_05870 [Micrococcales bacterium 73-15]
MTTPDTPETHGDVTGEAETVEPTETTESVTSEETSAAGAAHSAPRPAIDLGGRPVPPLPPSSPTPVAGEPTMQDPAAGPARVSAFGAKGAETGADDASGASTSPGRTVSTAPLPPETPVTATAPLPLEPGSTTTTRVVPPGSTVPLATPEALAGSTGGSLKTEKARSEKTTVEREAPQDEGWVPVSTRRTAAHIWGVVITLLVLPVAWFLLTDGALRTWWSLETTESTVNPAGVLSLVGGIIALVVIALVARASSLGAWIWGGVLAAAGLVVLVIPGRAAGWVEDITPSLKAIHEGFGQNLHDYLIDTGRSGLLLVLGIVVLLLALVSHTARRSGRTEGRVKAEREAAGL